MDHLESRFISNKAEPDAQKHSTYDMITKQSNNLWASSVKLSPEIVSVQEFLQLGDAKKVENMLLSFMGYIFQYHGRRFSKVFRKAIEDLPNSDLAHCNQARFGKIARI